MTHSGVDTCSIAFRPARESFFDSLLSRPWRAAKSGGMVFEQKAPGATKLGAFPAHGVVWWEGRLGALLDDNAKCWDLRPKSDLVAGEQVAREAIEQLAGQRLAPPGFCDDGELRRYDLAYELEFESVDGLAFMRVVAGMHAPRRKLNEWKSVDGQPETVYWRTPKRRVVTERIYDKGVESGSHPAGERIRIEAQRRPPKPKRRRPAVVARMDLASEFGRTIEPYLDNMD